MRHAASTWALVLVILTRIADARLCMPPCAPIQGVAPHPMLECGEEAPLALRLYGAGSSGEPMMAGTGVSDASQDTPMGWRQMQPEDGASEKQEVAWQGSEQHGLAPPARGEPIRDRSARSGRWSTQDGTISWKARIKTPAREVSFSF
jgi:hypothetical protein